MRYVLDGRTPRREDDLSSWATAFEVADRKVGLDEITSPAGHAVVSTVFLGLDHSFGGGPPLLFETMVFAVGVPAVDQRQHRYATWQQAEDGHRREVALVRRYLRRFADRLTVTIA